MILRVVEVESFYNWLDIHVTAFIVIVTCRNYC